MLSCSSTRNTSCYMNSSFLGMYKWLSCNHVLVQGIQSVLHRNARLCKVTVRPCYNLYLDLRSSHKTRLFENRDGHFVVE